MHSYYLGLQYFVSIKYNLFDIIKVKCISLEASKMFTLHSYIYKYYIRSNANMYCWIGTSQSVFSCFIVSLRWLLRSSQKDKPRGCLKYTHNWSDKKISWNNKKNWASCREQAELVHFKSKSLRMKIEEDESRVCDNTSRAPFLPLNFLVWLLVSFLFTWSNNRNDEVQKQKHWKLAEAKRGTTGILHCVNKDDFHLSLLFIRWLLIFTTVFLLNGAALLNISCSTGQAQIFSRDRWSVSRIWSLRLPWQ